ncbi:glutamate racemase [Neisseria sp. HSC-16F19]|nr:glutamate racemase [Neisseria sp. HSC-16F19]MCP2040283.1 glutamate racemase [Neisseria sp. HSC-16F19]
MTMPFARPIGLFDSGVGGVSIWRQIRALMPHEHTLYLADSRNAPYGQKSREEILALSLKNTEYLLERGAKIIVLACNTATTNAVKELRARYAVPFIGIEPAIKPAALQSKTCKVGVLATAGTINSALFAQTASNFRNIRFIEQIGHGLVPLIEAGQMESPAMEALLQEYLQPMIAADIDHLVLGCTHYPFLSAQIRRILPPHIDIIDSGAAVARQTRAVLQQHGLLADATQEGQALFYTNADETVLRTLVGGDGSVMRADF